VRVALLAESFLPHMNGVTGSVLQVLRHLAAEGHETLVIAPRSGEVTADLHGARTELLRSVPLPSYPEVRVVFARAARLAAILRAWHPDVVHLASPFVLGWQGVAAADALRIPTVAVYQTDVVAYAEKYGMPQASALVGRHIARLHRRATLTLAPSTASIQQLEDLGVDRLRHWGRGVDTARFGPERRSDAWRTAVARVAAGESVVGYVGRLAPEKQVEDLAALAALPGARVVVVGDGPSRAGLQQALPDAVFTGHLTGTALAEALASFDVFVHPGESETFGQTIQEALASGVPVVATGVGGPVDLVRSSVDGWLYRPGDLRDLRSRVADLVGDEGKRRAFAAAARESVRERTWDAVCHRLVDHYDEAQALRRIDDAQVQRGATRPAVPTPADTRPWSRFVALGDSITEGLCDTSRLPAGEFRGWADRLAQLLAHARDTDDPFRYANLAVRSKRVRDLLDDQLPRALALRPELVSILIGANDLVGRRVDPLAVAAQLEAAVRTLRAAGADVLLVTPFLPRRRAATLFARRFAVFSSELRRIAARTGAVLLDTDAFVDDASRPAIGDLALWADDKVHLRSRGHRYLAYRAAEALGVPHAEALAGLDAALHADDDTVADGTWLRRDALPWIWRRLRGRTAGDGRAPKHTGYVLLGGGGEVRARTAAG
jgi:phosphatidylinositol alpha 1,6-mannosyltransferase